MSPSEAPAITSPYRLSTAQELTTPSVSAALRRLAPVLSDQHRRLAVAFAATIVAAAMGLLGPVIIGRAVDVYMRTADFRGVLTSAATLLLAYLVGLDPRRSPFR